MARLLPLLVLLACSGSDPEPTDSSDPGDSAAPEDSGNTDATAIPLRMTFTDGTTGMGIDGAEVCTLLPETDGPCLTTDADGVIETDWTQSEYTNVLNRLTRDGYMTTLYTGRYDEEVYEGWMTGLETSDAIELGFSAFTNAAVGAYLGTADAAPVAGEGHALIFLLSGDGSSLDGASLVLENDAGEAAGQVLYQAPDSISLDASLTATSTAGVVTIINANPGEYTLRISHDTLSCVPGFAYSSYVPNTTTVPVGEDSLTLSSFFCFAG